MFSECALLIGITRTNSEEGLQCPPSFHTVAQCLELLLIRCCLVRQDQFLSLPWKVWRQFGYLSCSRDIPLHLSLIFFQAEVILSSLYEWTVDHHLFSATFYVLKTCNFHFYFFLLFFCKKSKKVCLFQF